MTIAEPIYRKVAPDVWDDDKFISLGDDAQSIWLLLLTGPHLTSIPGIQLADAYMLASARRWKPDRVEEALAEIAAAGMIEIDPRLRVIRLPNAPKHNPVANPSVLIGMFNNWQRLPQSPLKYAHIESIRKAIDFAEYASTDPDKNPLKCNFQAAWDATFGTVKTPCPTPCGTGGSTVGGTSVISDQGSVNSEQGVVKEVAAGAASAPVKIGAGRSAKSAREKTDESLPYSVTTLQQALAESSQRYVPTPLEGGPTINAQKLIRRFTLEQVQLAGAWLKAGGDHFKTTLDGRHLGDLPTWVAQAQAWDISGRRPIGKSNGMRTGNVAPCAAVEPEKAGKVNL